MHNGHSHRSHEALAGRDLRHPRLVIYPHVPICLVFYRHALSHFVLAQVESCGSLTSISQTIYKTCSDNPYCLLSESQIWENKYVLSISSAVVYNQRPIIHGAFIVLCFCWLFSDLAVADVTSSMWASLYKQASIWQRYASVLRVVFLFVSFFVLYLLVVVIEWNEMALPQVGRRIWF